MGKSKRADRRTGKHKEGSYLESPGPKPAPKGGKVSPTVAKARAARKQLALKTERAKLVASLALSPGESMGGGEARMVLLATCQLVEEAGLPLGDTPKSLRELNACYDRAAVLFRSTRLTIKRMYESYVESGGVRYEIADTSKRGRGSDEVDNASLYNISPEQAEAIESFITFSNSSEGAAKVILFTFLFFCACMCTFLIFFYAVGHHR